MHTHATWTTSFWVGDKTHKKTQHTNETYFVQKTTKRTHMKHTQRVKKTNAHTHQHTPHINKHNAIRVWQKNKKPQSFPMNVGDDDVEVLGEILGDDEEEHEFNLPRSRSK
jgi:hypothetical protein